MYFRRMFGAISYLMHSPKGIKGLTILLVNELFMSQKLRQASIIFDHLANIVLS